MKRKSQTPIETEEFLHTMPRFPSNFMGKSQPPTLEVITAATILYSFTNPQVYEQKKYVFSPPRIALQERPDVLPFHGGGGVKHEQLQREIMNPSHGGGVKYEQLKREIMNKAENKIVVSRKKELTRSDCLDSQGRLMLPRSFIKDEVKPLLNEDESLEDGIDVKVYNNQLQKFDMVFRSWAGSKVYILRSDWNKFYHENGLEKEMNVEICVFRHAVTGKICFAVLRI
ncbi:uncharacterized protein LOC113337872 [Papaver somniferum]|uniref:uncharacterized protein LOC113337872 n=1 Tax=Papaver somniferum TaxID=3469 RepID=UPI000E6FEF39|nr:uncharacterized protein LOC113337872 [Papaver somniferum]